MDFIKSVIIDTFIIVLLVLLGLAALFILTAKLLSVHFDKTAKKENERIIAKQNKEQKRQKREQILKEVEEDNKIFCDSQQECQRLGDEYQGTLKRFQESSNFSISNKSTFDYDCFSSELEKIPQVDLMLSNQVIKRRLVSDMPEIFFTNITKRTNTDKIFPLVVIDIETTGLKATNEIIEVSAIKYNTGFKPVSCFTTLVKPKRPIPPKATEINHITDSMVKYSPYFYQIAPQLHDYISGCNIVGHNVYFDLKFLFVYGVDLDEKRKYYDTLELAHKTLKGPKHKYYGSDWDDYEFSEDDFENDYNWEGYESDDCLYDCDVSGFKLKDLCNYYLIPLLHSHRSLDDCYATGKVFENLIKDKMSKR